MEFSEVSMEDAFEDLRKDLESGVPLSGPACKVRANKPMSKEEFSLIRKEMDLTQAQLAEILDISIKTVQSYEQGRIEPPGLVAKVLRLLRSNATFKTIFQGDIDPKSYSESAELLFAHRSGAMQEVAEQFMETVQKAYEKMNTSIQIQNMTGSSDQMSIKITNQNEAGNEW